MIETILFIIYVTIDAIYDKEMILRRKNVHTLGQYSLRTAIILAYTFLWGENWIGFLSFIAIYWFWFDGFFGYIYKKNIFYLSKKGLDGLQLRLGGQPAWFFFKFIFALGGAVYIIKPSLYQYP